MPPATFASALAAARQARPPVGVGASAPGAAAPPDLGGKTPGRREAEDRRLSRETEPLEDPLDALDPLARRAALLAPPAHVAPPMPEATTLAATPVAPAATASLVSLEDLLPQLVKRIAWSGDKRKASLRLELAEGSAHAGTTVTVHTDGEGSAGDKTVRLEIDGERGEELRERVIARLARRGIRVARD